MRFLRRTKAKKTILVISDLHLGAGEHVNGRINFLEDFHFDQELVEFLNYYSSGPYSGQEVELIINGDFLDFLAVPYVEYFDDEYWSEKAALDKLKCIISGHKEVFEALNEFVKSKHKKITYIIGNHDGEFIFEKARELFLQQFDEDRREQVCFYLGEDEYIPEEGIVIKHGHEYENAHQFDLEESIIENTAGEKYFVPPWGSYFVTRVINKFKEERGYINQVKPVKTLILMGLVLEPLFTLRFLISSSTYFIMVRFLHYFKKKMGLKNVWKDVKNELELFQDYEELTRDFLDSRSLKALIVGHSHQPAFRAYPEGKVFINTGTWTKMVNLDMGKMESGFKLTYAKVQIYDKAKHKEQVKYEHLDVALNMWQGTKKFPYKEFY